MDTFFSRYKNPLVLAIVLVALFFLVAVQVRRPFPAAAARVDQDGVRALRYGVATVVTPPESVLHKSGLSVRSVWSSYLDLIGVREENAQLRDEIDQLHMEQAALAEDARQGERLQGLLAFRQNYINATVPAQVVGTSGTDRSRVLYLDKGSEDGISADMPVITPDGIVGRIRDVYPHTSQVLEISDPTSASGVLLEETRTRGILRGSPQGQPQIVNLMPDDRIKPGQVVLTSGGDQIFPRGLPVGVVDHIAPDLENEPMVNVVLKPAANLGRLEEVLVVTGTGPAPSQRARKDLSKSELMAAGARAGKEVSAEQAALVDAQRASDVLAQRLPSRYDPANFYAPDATPDSSPATTEAAAKPLHPPSALHPDHYTPGSNPAAQSLTPGQRYAPLVEGTAATERRPSKAGDQGVNATDNAPVSTDPAFSSATAAMAAQRKAAAEAKAAADARQYALLHPEAVKASGPADASVPASNSATGTASAPAVLLSHYIEHTDADGHVTRSPVPTGTVLYSKRVNEDGTASWVLASGAPSTGAVPGSAQYTNRTNADGTVTRVPVPSAAGAGLYMARVNADGTTSHVRVLTGAPAPAVRYINRTNADGTVTRVAVPAAPAVTYTTRTNADGTVTRVPVPATSVPTGAVQYTNRTNADGTITRVAVPAISASGAPAIRYTNRTNADGTVTRVPVPASSAPGAVTYTNRTNADGTVTRVPVPSAPGTTPAVHYTTRANADGTTTRIPVTSTVAASPTTAVRYTNRTNADGTVTRVPVPATTGSGSSTGTGLAPTQPRAAVAPAVSTRVIADGPLPAGSRAATNPRPAPTQASGGTAPSATPKPAVRPSTAVPGAATPATPAGANPPAAARRKTTPVIVPDDGSRPPAPKPSPQEQH